MAELKLALRIDSLQMTLQKSLQVAARMGVTSVELNARAGTAPNCIDPSSLSDTGLRSIHKMLDDVGLKVAAIRFPTRRGYDHLEDLDRRMDATKQAMALAYRLKAPVVINGLGPIPESEDDPRYETLKSVVGDLGRHGARVGAFFAAETGAESGGRLMDLLESSTDGYVAVALNPGQWIINQIPVAESTSAVSQRVKTVCAVDGVLDLAAGRGLTLPLGQGIVDFPELIGILEESHYRGPFIVGRGNCNPDELAQGVQYFKAL